ncbi:hypothetical protein SPBR_06010 [Sporothrix brasiliensis 5110]|uniref:Rhodopsin domain-containing protein n=1 Tax=Sporothrix brasiliensis 5110 TaxID=1398154 RepID=A0A0C2IY89_9PEZI|nr:uncharacterized protein SPBR_06010 [Sporothrix brasiliensis 5110]KIH94061.1 hypothetical protein SPBR_06010 [Sporothrix brasiliensis 5110]
MDNRGPQLAAVLVACLALTIVSTILRCYSMAVLLKRFYLEDWLAVLSLCLYCVFTAAGLLCVHFGIGQHVANVPPESRVNAVLWRWVGSLLYIAISTLSKYVVGLFLLRICSHCRWQRWTILILLAVVGVFNVMYFFFDVFACHPIAYEWTRYAEPPRPATGADCHATSFAMGTAYVSAFLNVVADWILAILPCYLVWQAKMELRKRLSVCCVLALGSVASVATIVRIPYASGILDQPDFLYNFTDLAIWSTLEIGIALTASSLATLTPLFRKIKFFSATYATSRTGGESAAAAKPGRLPSSVQTGAQPGEGRGTEESSQNQECGGHRWMGSGDGDFGSDLELQPMEQLSSGSDRRLEGTLVV